MLTKGRRDALEKVWMREVSNTLPFPSNARIYYQLEREGLLQRGADVRHARFGSYVMRGWYLTHAGRIAYCTTCEDETEPHQQGTEK